MWLDCKTEQQIADAIQVHQTTVGEWIREKRQQPEFLSPPESRQHFDVWQFATADDDAGTPSVVRQTDRRVFRVRRARFTFSKMSVARAVQMNGCESAARSDRNTSPDTAPELSPPPPTALSWATACPDAGRTSPGTRTLHSVHASAASAGR